MSRSVVLAGAARCRGCSLPPRWCTCAMLAPVTTRLSVHLLIHRHEQVKPSSTGTLVGRVVTGASTHTYQRANRFFPATGLPADSLAPGRTLWVLHPRGEPWPTGLDARGADQEEASRLPGTQILLLDGTWRQAGEMLRSLEGFGQPVRCVRLPETTAAPSRYWLRDQPAAIQLSTAEALMAVFRSVGEPEAADRLRLHFELHVYATLRARGRREMAERYLGHSPLPNEATDALDRLHAREK